jgi:hypothetical protein
VPDYSSKLDRTGIERSFFVQDASHMTRCKISSATTTAFQDLVPVLDDCLQMIDARAEDGGAGNGASSLNGYVGSDPTAAQPESAQSASPMLTDNSAILEALNFAELTMKEQQFNNLWSEEGSFT